MTIVRELVTKLSFKLDNTGLAEYSKNISAVQQRAKSLLGSFQTSALGQGLKSLQNNLKAATDSTPSLAMPTAVSDRIKELTTYSNELKGLSASERRDVLELNRIEKQAIREVSTEQRKSAAEKRKSDLEEKRRIAEINKERKKTNFLEGLGKVTSFANRALTGIFGAATASLGFSYKEYKTYAKNKKEGRIIKTSLTPEQIKQFEAFDKVAKSFKETIANLRNAFSVALLPAITAVLKTFNEWYKINKKIIDNKLKNFATQLGYAFKTIGVVLGKVLPIVSSLINIFGGLENVILGLIGIKIGGWVIAIAGFLATPLGAIAALGAAFYLLYDEIKTALNGGESYIGDFANSTIAKFTKMTDAMIDWLGVRDKVEALRTHVKERQAAGRPEYRGERLAREKKEAINSTLSILGGINPANLTTSMPQYNPNNAEFMQRMAVSNNNRNVVNNINGGGVSISINNTGNIDDNAVKKLAKQLNNELDQKISDIFSLAIPTVIN